ncbi:MAG: penicillin-binding protein activator [Proteobacteria bacterium]|nr:penicillin-binding protein activator [Pseudomonadota bacterium]
MTQRLLSLLFLGVLILLTGCAPQPVTPSLDANTAEQLFAKGDNAAAARQFMALAQQSESAEQTNLRLRASAAWAAANKLHQARQILQSLDLNTNNRRQSFLADLARAHIALIERRPEDVLTSLATSPEGIVDKFYLADYYGLRASAYTMLGNRLETAQELVMRERYLTDPELIAHNQQLIWQSLAMLSERSLQQLRTAPPPDVLSGWMELIQITKAYQLQPATLKEAVIQWRQSYPNHPVNSQLLTDLMSREPEDIATPDHIALLLPLSGKYAPAGEAVRDGFLAAYYSRTPTTAQVVKIYDTESEPNILAIYQQAVNDGAEFIVGPLNKTRIEFLADSGKLAVPTLALNYIPREDIPANLYQFGLSPEEEARQVAERTWLDGYVNAAVLIPEGPWGQRITDTFTARWQEIGGIVVEQQTYNASRNDYSDPIRQLLNIDESKRRYRSLAALLNQTVKYTPRRRQDIEFIFLAAYPRQARQIRPQLKFYHAMDIPIYATSHVFTGNLNPERDRDMDGLMFGDMPWVLADSTAYRGLHTELEPYISQAGNRLQRLYALGIDSFNIIAALSTLKKYPYQRYDGETGSLSLDPKQRIHRQLTWVRFRSGRPMPLDETIQ